jgi:hypothetical protein
VLAYNDLSLIAALAAAIFVFRADSLMLAHSRDEIVHIMSDCSRLKVVPLLQAFLFPMYIDVQESD